MTLLACGLNHETAPIALRERVAITADQLPTLLSDLLMEAGIFEAVVLSTCNRTEIYADGESSEALLNVLAQFCCVPFEEIKEMSYHYYDQDMVRHVMRVACGLDAMVLGEPQILGQMKQAISVAEEHAAIGEQLHRLFQQVFSVAKKVRTHTEVGVCPVSVASTAVRLAKEKISNFENACALLVGAGDTIALVIKHLKKQGLNNIMIASRKMEKAQVLAAQFDAQAMRLTDLPEQLKQADLVFTATASSLPILGKGAVETAMQQRDESLCIVDIAVPRDVEAEVAEVENVSLFGIDDLKQVIQENLQNRQHAAQKAEDMIVQETQSYMKWLRSLGSVNTIRALRGWMDSVREEEITKALRLLKGGMTPEQAMRRLANALGNKLMHPPSTKLREASSEGRVEFVEYVHALFDLDD